MAWVEEEARAVGGSRVDGALLEHGIVSLEHGPAFLQLLPALTRQHRRRTETAAPWGRRRSAVVAGSQSQHRASVRVPPRQDTNEPADVERSRCRLLEALRTSMNIDPTLAAV